MNLECILLAHGGAERWQRVTGLEIVFSARGALFTFKQVPRLHRISMWIGTREPETALYDYPQPGLVTCFRADEKLQILSNSGDLQVERRRPRAAFATFRCLFHWDALDFAYFCSYAMWNYLNTPFLFLRPDLPVTVKPSDLEGYTTQVGVRFPPDLPSHCEYQTFWFDSRGLLARHDYTAEVVGSWARAVHLSDEYRCFDGLWIPTRRRVHPLLFGSRPFRGVTLVALDIHEVKLIEQGGPALRSETESVPGAGLR